MRSWRGSASPTSTPRDATWKCASANLSVVSFYVPSGSSSEERLAVKFSFLERVIEPLHQLAQSGREIVICGDWNIAHQQIDLKNWRSNQKNPGFLPEERAWLSGVFEHLRYVDVFRRLDPRPEQYTWWSNRGQAWAKNVGWRLDYQIATAGDRGDGPVGIDLQGAALLRSCTARPSTTTTGCDRHHRTWTSFATGASPSSCSWASPRDCRSRSPAARCRPGSPTAASTSRPSVC